MHITHLIKSPTIGGIEKYVENLIPEHDEQQDTYSIIFTRGGEGALREGLLLKNTMLHTVPWRISSFRPYRFSIFIQKCSLLVHAISLFFKLLSIKPDIVHSHLSVLAETATQIRVCSLLNIPFVWTIHTQTSANMKDMELLRKVLLQTSSPVAMTYVGEYPPIFSSLPISQRGIRVIHTPPGINLSAYENASIIRDKNREVFRLPNEEFVIGFMGRLSTEKGVDVLISAFRSLSTKYDKLKLLLAGDGYERDYLESLSGGFQKEGRIQFLGEVHDVVDFFSLLDLYVQPSLSEGLPIVVLEAMASGVPVVCTDVGGVSILVENNISGLLVPSKDVGSLSKAMDYMIANNKNRKGYSDNAQKKVAGYEINNSRMLFQKIYTELLG